MVLDDGVLVRDNRLGIRPTAAASAVWSMLVARRNFAHGFGGRPYLS